MNEHWAGLFTAQQQGNTMNELKDIRWQDVAVSVSVQVAAMAGLVAVMWAFWK
jgi:hypothetical protein